jgi:hypothetical protein
MYFAHYSTYPESDIDPATIVSSISLQDFLTAAEQLRVKMTPRQGKAIFSVLDLNGDDKIGYNEFCHIAVEEQRMKLLEDIRNKKIILQEPENEE